MKKLVVVLLMFIFAYVQVGYYFHSLLERRSLQQEFEKKSFSALPEATLERFVLEDNKDIRWEEGRKEFWLRGQLYDVVKKMTANNKTYLYCLKDSKEETVVEQQVKITKNNTNNSGKNSKAVKFSIEDFILFANEAATHASARQPQKFYLYKQKEMVLNKQPLSPPPQV